MKFTKLRILTMLPVMVLAGLMGSGSALAACNEAVRIDPNNAGARANLAWARDGLAGGQDGSE